MFQSMASEQIQVDSGDEVSGYYDPMIAKMIATGTDRQEAATACPWPWPDVSYWTN